MNGCVEGRRKVPFSLCGRRGGKEGGIEYTVMFGDIIMDIGHGYLMSHGMIIRTGLELNRDLYK